MGKKRNAATTRAASQKQAVRDAGLSLPTYISAHRKVWLTMRRLAELSLDGPPRTDPFGGDWLNHEEKLIRYRGSQKSPIASAVLPMAKMFAERRIAASKDLTGDDAKRARLVFIAQEYIRILSTIQRAQWKAGHDIEGLAQMVSLDGVREQWVCEEINKLHETMLTGTPDARRQAAEHLHRVGEALIETGGGRPRTRTHEERTRRKRRSVAVSKTLPAWIKLYRDRVEILGPARAQKATIAAMRNKSGLQGDRLDHLIKRFTESVDEKAREV